MVCTTRDLFLRVDDTTYAFISQGADITNLTGFCHLLLTDVAVHTHKHKFQLSLETSRTHKKGPLGHCP